MHARLEHRVENVRYDREERDREHGHPERARGEQRIVVAEHVIVHEVPFERAVGQAEERQDRGGGDQREDEVSLPGFRHNQQFEIHDQHDDVIDDQAERENADLLRLNGVDS